MRELKWKLNQRCWLEVKRFALDDSLGCQVHKGIVLFNFPFNFHERSEFTSTLTSIIYFIHQLFLCFDLWPRRSR